MIPEFLKQGKRDSNSRERFWRPSYYHCMIPLGAVNEVYYIKYIIHVQEKISTFHIFIARRVGRAVLASASARGDAFLFISDLFYYY